MSAGIVLYGMILFHSKEQTLGGAPKKSSSAGQKLNSSLKEGL
jgi:hypothetical protein